MSYSPYQKLLDHIKYNKYINIYNLRNGKINWRITFHDQISLEFIDRDVVLSWPIRYSNKSNKQITILKSHTWVDCFSLELFYDYMHTECKLPITPILYGFIIYHNQDKIAIAL